VSWFTLERDGVSLHGLDQGSGVPVVFQHGLGGDEAQVAEVFPDVAGFRRLTLECRGQGRSQADDARNYSIATFADDVLAFAQSRGVERFIAGGISMGAAIALRLAARYPRHVVALVLARPAWLWHSAPANMKMFAEVADHLRNPDRQGALAAFEASDTARMLAREAPDNLVSMRKFLTVEHREALAALLSAVAGDSPGVSETEVRAMAAPTLVIGTAADVAHPLAFARTLAASIAGSDLVEITAKSIDKPRYIADFRKVLSTFLTSVSHSKGMPT
jgi:pimeloyl-ACP methyl ester carboxylesterase